MISVHLYTGAGRTVGTLLSCGTVAAITSRAAGRLDAFLDVVRGRLAEAEVAGFEETGLRVAGRLHWLHCARTGKYTLVSCHPRRGLEAMDAMWGCFRPSPESPSTTHGPRKPGIRLLRRA